MKNYCVKVARLVERHRIERHYREIVEQAADIIYTRDMDGRITSMNTAGARFFGRSALEIRGCHLSELVGAEAGGVNVADKNHAGALPLRSTYRLQDARGELRCLEELITVKQDRRGEAIGVRGIIA